jgi:hypothetical protein
VKRTAFSQLGRTTAQQRITDWRSLVPRVVGAGLLIATGAIHLDLYLTGYRTIPTIGWLFLVQIITAFGLGLIVLMFRSRLAAAGGAGFAVATLGGYLLSLRVGLFGFREVRTSAGIVAGVIEVAAFAALAWSALKRGSESINGSKLTPENVCSGFPDGPSAAEGDSEPIVRLRSIAWRPIWAFLCARSGQLSQVVAQRVQGPLTFVHPQGRVDGGTRRVVGPSSVRRPVRRWPCVWRSRPFRPWCAVGAPFSL